MLGEQAASYGQRLPQFFMSILGNANDIESDSIQFRVFQSKIFW